MVRFEDGAERSHTITSESCIVIARKRNKRVRQAALAGASLIVLTAAAAVNAGIIDQLTSQSNSNAQVTIDAVSDPDHVASNAVPVITAGDGLTASSSAAAAVLRHDHDVSQANDSAQDADDVFAGDGDSMITQESDQSNENSQTGVAQATSGNVSAENSSSIEAGGHGMIAETTASSAVDRTQDVEQTNATDQKAEADIGTNGDASITQSITQSNENSQTGTAEATAGDAIAENSGTVQAGGDGVVASSSAAAALAQNQIVEQTNDAAQDADATIGNDGDASISQAISQRNQNTQVGTATASTGQASVENNGFVDADANGMVANSSAGAAVNQSQDVQQTNAAVYAGDAIVAGAGDESVSQEIDQSNQSSQIGTAQAIAGDVFAENHGSIEAGGNGIVATSSAEARVEQTQQVFQMNSAIQSGTSSVANENTQVGVAGAVSGDVLASNYGEVGTGGDGIIARSTAKATVSQLANAGEQTATANATAGDVGVHNSGEVEANGRGVVAESLANGDTAQAGTVQVTSGSFIRAGQEAIVARSSANGGLGSNITLDILGGDIVGGDGFYAIYIIDGLENTLTNSGFVTSLSNHAIRGGIGNETVHNFGRIDGDVDLGLGTNAFFNQPGGLFNTFNIVDLNGGVLTNSGFLSPGGVGTFQTTAIDGSFVNTGSGQWIVDVDFGSGESDFLDITGTASLDGEVIPIPAVGLLDSFAFLEGQSQAFLIASAAGGTTDNGITAEDTFFIDYALLFPNFTDVVLSANIDMTSTEEGLNRNQLAIGEFLNRALAGGVPPDLLDLYASLFTLSDIPSLAAAFDQLSPEVHLDTSLAAISSGLHFSDGMLSCSATTGAYVFVRQEECYWARVSGRLLDYDRSFENIGFEEESISISGGMQRQIGENLHLGLGLGFETTDLETGTGATNEADRIQAGVALKYTHGPWLVAGVLSGGFGWHDAARPIVLPGLTALATVDHQSWNLTAQVRGAYEIDLGSASYLKPRIDLAFSHVSIDGFTEVGGPLALQVREIEEGVVTATPALEWGTEFLMGEVVRVRPYMWGGVTGFSDDEFNVDVALLGAPDVAPFRITKETDKWMGVAGAGVEIFGTPEWSVRLDYRGRFGNQLDEHALAVKGSLFF